MPLRLAWSEPHWDDIIFTLAATTKEPGSTGSIRRAWKKQRSSGTWTCFSGCTKKNASPANDSATSPFGNGGLNNNFLSSTPIQTGQKNFFVHVLARPVLFFFFTLLN